jgi:hypothetical protein
MDWEVLFDIFLRGQIQKMGMDEHTHNQPAQSAVNCDRDSAPSAYVSDRRVRLPSVTCSACSLASCRPSIYVTLRSFAGNAELLLVFNTESTEPLGPPFGNNGHM